MHALFFTSRRVLNCSVFPSVKGIVHEKLFARLVFKVRLILDNAPRVKFSYTYAPAIHPRLLSQELAAVDAAVSQFSSTAPEQLPSLKSPLHENESSASLSTNTPSFNNPE